MYFQMRWWSLVTPILCALGATLCTPRVVEAQLAPARAHQSTANLDGHYLTIGPVAAAAWAQDSWVSAVGAEVSWIRLREHRMPAAYGLAVGGVRFGDRDGARFWLELEFAVKRPLPFALGLSAGLTLDLPGADPPRYGAQGTLWVFAGVIPYLRIGSVMETGTFVEAGLMIKLPVKIRR
jgi:hypothetical protein